MRPSSRPGKAGAISEWISAMNPQRIGLELARDATRPAAFATSVGEGGSKQCRLGL